MFNHMFIINVFSFRYTHRKSRAVFGFCQTLYYTYWRFCRSWQWEFQNCGTETWRNILCYGGDHGECCVLEFTQEQDFFIITSKKKL